MGKPKGKRLFGRTGRRWEYNIKMDLQEVGSEHGIYLAQNRDRWRIVVNVVMKYYII